MSDRAWTHPDRTLTTHIPTPRRGLRVDELLLRQTSNLPVRVPTVDWNHVTMGAKGMFRTYNGFQKRETPAVDLELPMPRACLLFAHRTGPVKVRHWEAMPGVLLSAHQEPLGAISDADLESEGFATITDFRAYWTRRYPRWGWRPWDKVTVVSVRPMRESDRRKMADKLFEQLYGEWT